MFFTKLAYRWCYNQCFLSTQYSTIEMRKLIETVRKSLIVCDNPKCDYEIPYSEEEEKVILKYINAPCPLCGQNLLTEQDYLQDEKIMRLIRWLNKWFSWITFFYSKKSWSKRQVVSVHVHDGVKIKNETDVEAVS